MKANKVMSSRAHTLAFIYLTKYNWTRAHARIQSDFIYEDFMEIVQMTTNKKTEKKTAKQER